MPVGAGTDATRVATFMFGNSVSNKNFSFVEGVKGGHHELSHHMGSADSLDKLTLINTWEVGELAYLIGRARGTARPSAVRGVRALPDPRFALLRVRQRARPPSGHAGRACLRGWWMSRSAAR